MWVVGKGLGRRNGLGLSGYVCRRAIGMAAWVLLLSRDQIRTPAWPSIKLLIPIASGVGAAPIKTTTPTKCPAHHPVRRLPPMHGPVAHPTPPSCCSASTSAPHGPPLAVQSRLTAASTCELMELIDRRPGPRSLAAAGRKGRGGCSFSLVCFRLAPFLLLAAAPFCSLQDERRRLKRYPCCNRANSTRGVQGPSSAVQMRGLRPGIGLRPAARKKRRSF